MASVTIGDDLIFALQNLEATLSELGHNVENKAMNAVDALRLYRQNPTDLVILDVKGMKAYYEESNEHIDSFSAVKHIKNLNPKVRIILITATPEQKDVTQAVTAGADGILAKGFDLDRLRKTIHDVLDKVK
jgi:DNA-binding NarL/FixJ family response regulator